VLRQCVGVESRPIPGPGDKLSKHTQLYTPGHPTSATPTPGVSPSWSSRPRVKRETWNTQYAQRANHKGKHWCFALPVSCPTVLARCAEACDKTSTNRTAKTRGHGAAEAGLCLSTLDMYWTRHALVVYL